MSFASLPSDLKKCVSHYMDFGDWEAYTLTSKETYNSASIWPDNKIEVIFEILKTDTKTSEYDAGLVRKIKTLFETILKGRAISIFSKPLSIDSGNFLYLCSLFPDMPVEAPTVSPFFFLNFYNCDIGKFSQCHGSPIKNLVAAVRLENSDLSSIKKVSDLFPCVNKVEIRRGAHTWEESGKISLIPSIKTLKIDGFGRYVTKNEALLPLNSLPNLQEIDLKACDNFCHLSDTEVPCKSSLKILRAPTTIENDDLYLLLEKFSSLETIDISHCREIKNIMADRINPMSSVKVLALNGTDLTDNDFAVLANKFAHLELVDRARNRQQIQQIFSGSRYEPRLRHFVLKDSC